MVIEMEHKENFIDSGVNLLTAAMSLANPAVGLIGAALSPIISNGAKSILPKSLSERENKRVEFIFENIIRKISAMLEKGFVPRLDEMYYANGLEIPNAQELFEGVLLKAREEHQAKKLLLYYSTFFANVCFDETINIEHSHFLLCLIERLTYRQLTILSYLSDGKHIQTNRWDSQFKVASNSELVRYYDFYSEYVDLYNIRLITQTDTISGFSLGMSETKISDMGYSVVRLLELKDILKEDVDNVKKYFDAIAEIIARV